MLSRELQVGESWGVGDLRIVVLRVRGQEVRLGIEAPRHVPIRRAESVPVVEESAREWWDDLDPSEMPRF